MSNNNRGSLSSGIVLILIGIIFLISRLVPSFNIGELWPFIVLAVGIFFLVSGVISNPRLLIPGTIVTYSGSILLYTNLTEDWQQWKLWLLAPAAVGLGIFLSEWKIRKDIKAALAASWMLMAIGTMMFLLFLLPFGWDKLWPFVLIVIGVGILIRNRTSGGDRQ